MKNFFSLYKRQWYWMALGAFTLLLRALSSYIPEVVEVIYAKGIFAAIRYVIDYTVGWSPVPLLYVLIVFVGWMLYKWIKAIRRPKKVFAPKWLNHILAAVLNFLAFAGGVVAAFFFLWGFNYARVPLETHLSLQRVEADVELLKAEAQEATGAMLSAREQLTGDQPDTLAISFHLEPHSLENHMRKNLCLVLKEMGYPTPGRVRGRKIFPKGWMIGLGASGVYLPFVAEGHFDAALYPLQHPPVIAHEMGHGYGFTDEGVCNFLGFLACEASENPYIQYCGRLDYWRHVVSDLNRADPLAYKAIYARLPKGVRADLQAIRENHQKYPGWFPNFSRSVYNRYLKGQGVEGGIRSYRRVVALVMAWKRQRSD